MDKAGAERLARGITIATHGDRNPGATTAMHAKAQPLTALADDGHGWAVRVTTASGSTVMVIDAGQMIRDLENAERQWASVRDLAEYAIRHR